MTINQLARHFLRSNCIFGLLFLTVGHLSAANTWTLIGWSDFGINQMERDYSVYAIYPPYGTVHAQLIDPTGTLYTGGSGVTVTYQAIADPSGSINSTSAGKTNFWQYAQGLFGGSPVLDTGITGSKMPGSGNTPQPMTFDSSYNRFTSDGVPITPYDDTWNRNYYPLMKLTATDASGNVLASARITLPVSNELQCRSCHASGTDATAQPAAGWANDSNPNRDPAINILQLHDEKNRRNPAYQSALASLNYSSSGLAPTAQSGTPIACTACHSSNLFNNAGITGIESLTGAMHVNHSGVIDPVTEDTLDNGTDRATCYNCHAGPQTQALRGVMGSSVAANGTLQVQCQSCHGNLSALGDPSRRGWIDLPNCQACHTGTALTMTAGVALTNALDSSGALNQTTDTTFATTPNQPVAGASLYRFSTGHGNLQCAACHGATHAELPSSQANDDLQAMDLTGTAGPIRECTVCHQSGISSTSGGPHGMHDVGAGWVSTHSRVVGRTATACQLCHGTDYRGTPLSMAFTTRTISTQYGTIQMFRGYQVSCYTCHNGPNGGEGGGTQSPAPTVANTTASASSGQSVTIPITVTAGSVLRVVSQPQGGTAHVSGNSIVYIARANFEGSDQITYAAINNGRDSNLGSATVTVRSSVRPTFAAASVTNAASYAPGVSPGMIAYFYGANMGPANIGSYELNSGGFIEKATAGTRVLFNGVPSPLLYSSDSQVSAIVPYEVTGSTANVIVEYNGIQSAVVPLPVSPALPGIFTANSSGQGPAAVLNQDGSANSALNPAQRGSVVSLFVTGTGATNPGGIDALLGIAPYPVPMQPVTVTVGGQPATVQYAGGAQGLVAGMMQINAVVPQNIPPGAAAIVVSVGGIASQSAVTVAVQ